MLKTPVLLLTYNRSKPALRVLEAVRQARPQRLFLAADGPRAEKPGDAERCAETRRLVRAAIDWDCEVQTLFRERNLGCRHAVSSAITWFFEQVEEGIVLEDDTVPAPDFFPFCEALLERYRHNPAIRHISGDNFQFGRQRGQASYYFSIYTHVWGWASWRRAWQFYDVEMKAYPARRQERQWLELLSGPEEQQYWLKILDEVHQGKINTWDYQWAFANFLNGGLSVMPNVNLVSNIGHGADATHTDGHSPLAELPVGQLGSLTHPEQVAADKEADRFTFEHVIAPRRPSLAQKIARFFQKKPARPVLAAP